jgi:hypothetical protein
MLGARRLAWITAAASVTVVIGATASWIHGRGAAPPPRPPPPPRLQH